MDKINKIYITIINLESYRLVRLTIWYQVTPLECAEADIQRLQFSAAINYMLESFCSFADCKVFDSKFISYIDVVLHAI